MKDLRNVRMKHGFLISRIWYNGRAMVVARRLLTHSLLLVKEKEYWYLTTQSPTGIRIPIPHELAEQMAATFLHTHDEEDWIDKRSWQFHWWRFWYRRKKRREQLRQNQHNASTK